MGISDDKTTRGIVVATLDFVTAEIQRKLDQEDPGVEKAMNLIANLSAEAAKGTNDDPLKDKLRH